MHEPEQLALDLEPETSWREWILPLPVSPGSPRLVRDVVRELDHEARRVLPPNRPGRVTYVLALRPNDAADWFGTIVALAISGSPALRAHVFTVLAFLQSSAPWKLVA